MPALSLALLSLSLAAALPTPTQRSPETPNEPLPSAAAAPDAPVGGGSGEDAARPPNDPHVAADTTGGATGHAGETGTGTATVEGPPPAARPARVSSSDDPFKLDLAVDLPILGAASALFLTTELIQGQFAWAGCQSCDTSHLGPLDRRVLDNHSPAAATTSDILLYTTVGAPFVADLADVLIHKQGMRSWAKDLAVLVEVGAVNSALTNVVKYAVDRPRPYSYGQSGGDLDPTEGDARLSFYSGHTSTAFAMASAYGYLFQARHPTSKWRAPVWLLGYAMATTTGVMRVTAGKHFWSDVAVGAIAGSAIGLVIPALHRRRPSSRRFAGRLGLNLAATRRGPGITLRGAF